MASRIVYALVRIEDTTESGLDFDVVADSIGAEVDRRRHAGEIGAAPKTVLVSAKPLRALGRGKKRNFNYTYRSRDEADEES